MFFMIPERWNNNYHWAMILAIVTVHYYWMIATQLASALQYKKVAETICYDETAPIDVTESDRFCYWQSIFGGFLWHTSSYTFPIASAPAARTAIKTSKCTVEMAVHMRSTISFRVRTRGSEIRGAGRWTFCSASATSARPSRSGTT